MNCRICKSDNLYLYYVQGANSQYRYYRCNDCRLVNLDLQSIVITDSQQKYFDNYKPHKDYEKVTGSYNAYKFVSKYVPGTGRILDIGCGFGSVLYFFRKYGWKVKGLELSAQLADHVKEKLKIEVEVCDFLKYTGEQGQYDLVSIRQVLEHLPDSVLALTKIHGLLKANGYAYLEFPNIEGLSHKLQRARNKIVFLRKKYNSSYSPGHCNEFSKFSFEYLLGKTGFKLVRWETYSRKPFSSFIYNHIHIGTKARVIIQKI